MTTYRPMTSATPASLPKGRSVFITGASSGIGATLARHYAAQGATLGLLARRADVLKNLVRELPGNHQIFVADVVDADAMLSAGEQFMAQVGPPDIVIANAGISAGTLTEERADLAVFQRIINVNVLGMLHTFHPFVEAMKQRGQGHLVGIASVAGIRGFPGASAYSASKAAAISYLESLRIELRGSGVKVVTIAPGYIATPMTAGNPYPMPFLRSVEEAVLSITAAIDAGKSYAVLPWPMAIVAKLLHLLPNSLFDALFAKAGRKRRLPGI